MELVKNGPDYRFVLKLKWAESVDMLCEGERRALQGQLHGFYLSEKVRGRSRFGRDSQPSLGFGGIIL